MQDVEELISRLIEISEVKLAGGWRGWVAVREGGRERFSRTEWEALLAEPEKLLDGAQEVLKSNDFKVITVKYLAIGGRGVKAVMKCHHGGRGLREFLRVIRASRGLRSFIAAVRARQAGLAVAAPLAAVFRRSLFYRDQSIYISEYVDGVGLQEFLKNLPEDLGRRHRIIRRLSEQTAEILAGLHNKGLWHSNAKASDFIVSGNGPEDYRLVLTDMEGIKQYFLRKEARRMQMLRQLAASVTALGAVGRTDFLRVFRAYSEKAGLPEDQQRAVFRRLAHGIQSKYH